MHVVDLILWNRRFDVLISNCDCFFHTCKYSFYFLNISITCFKLSNSNFASTLRKKKEENSTCLMKKKKLAKTYHERKREKKRGARNTTLEGWTQESRNSLYRSVREAHPSWNEEPILYAWLSSFFSFCLTFFFFFFQV